MAPSVGGMICNKGLSLCRGISNKANPSMAIFAHIALDNICHLALWKLNPETGDKTCV